MEQEPQLLLSDTHPMCLVHHQFRSSPVGLSPSLEYQLVPLETLVGDTKDEKPPLAPVGERLAVVPELLKRESSVSLSDVPKPHSVFYHFFGILCYRVGESVRTGTSGPWGDRPLEVLSSTKNQNHPRRWVGSVELNSYRSCKEGISDRELPFPPVLRSIDPT